MSIEKILVVDDEEILRNFMAETLLRLNLDVTTAANGKIALNLVKENHFDIIFTDMKMPELTGIDLLKEVKLISPSTFVIVVTAYGSIENAVEAMRLGAFNYLIKPFSPDTIEAVIEKVKEHQQLIEENHYLRREVSNRGDLRKNPLVTQSPAMKKILKDIERIAKSNANVFITGESGTGKEVLASEIHFNSLRANNPFIKVNCAAIPETLIESEFFGHEKGSFTGAHARRLGRFELANKGTLLLDEITEVPISLQAKLLRVIQEQEFERVGGVKPVNVDVRIISTSNRNIEEAIKNKILREDLFYRLNVVPIVIPSLVNRQEDILPLAEFFIQKFCQESHLELKFLTENAKDRLKAYTWPGNVRELANIIERAVVMERGQQIDADSLIPGFAGEPQHNLSQPNNILKEESLKELEKRHIIEILKLQNNNRTKAAEVLQISVRTLRNKLKEYSLE